MSQQIRALRTKIGCEFGVGTRATATILGPVLFWTSRREPKRLLAGGKTYEPKAFIEHRNWQTQTGN